MTRFRADYAADIGRGRYPLARACVRALTLLACRPYADSVTVAVPSESCAPDMCDPSPAWFVEVYR